MFDRKKYKRFARMQLKSRWLTPVLMTLIAFVIIFAMNIPAFINSLKDSFKTMDIIIDSGPEIANRLLFSMPTSPYWKAVYNLASWAGMLVQFVLEFSMISVYVKMSHGPEPVSIENFIEGLSLWAKGILCGMWKALWIFLWSLLFIIPGLVKSYAYSQTEYLLNEYPELSVTKAMRISILITRGYKGDLFIQDLSFIGWQILATLSLGIGYLWLVPYMYMTRVNAFHGLLRDAVATGIITKEDLK